MTAPTGYPPPQSPVIVQTAPRGLFYALTAILATMLLFSVVVTLFSCVAAFGAVAASAGATTRADAEFRTVPVKAEGAGPERILQIALDGVLLDEPREEGFFRTSESPVEAVASRLRFALKDTRVQAIVLAVNSPGGGIGASDAIRQAILDFKKESGGKVPIVVHMGDLAASGGYYVSAPADWIVASPTTLTGSIGVILTHVNMRGFMEEILKIRVEPIKSAERKDIGSPFREMTPAERAELQALVDSMFERFLNVVREGRGERLKKDLRALATGSIFTADQALDSGLVDSVGYRRDAYQEARRLAGLAAGAGEVVEYRRPPSPFDQLFGRDDAPTAIRAVRHPLARLLAPDAVPILYLWSPALTAEAAR